MKGNGLEPVIFVTLGPASLKEDILVRLAREDIALLRINLSHTPLDCLEQTIRDIQKHTTIDICVDSEGAQIRNQEMAGNKAVFLEGDDVEISFAEVVGDANRISFYPPNVARDFVVGDRVRVDFDSVCLVITEQREDCCRATVEHGGRVGSNRAADVDREISLDPITVKDRAAFKIAAELGITQFALSFANCREDVQQMRRLVGEEAHVICKIESKNGLLNLGDILDASDSIIIDRGDLSRQVPIEQIPFLQRRIVSMARSKRKPVLVATNLLETLTTSRNPTRAEVNDVVSTLLMGANGLVLAAETAIGMFPVEAVQMARRLIEEFQMWTPNTSIEEILGNGPQN